MVPYYAHMYILKLSNAVNVSYWCQVECNFTAEIKPLNLRYIDI
jgi:hypothetical protein